MGHFGTELLITFAEAAKSKLLPGRRHISTLHRWHLRGVRGVRLETTMVGGRRYTSNEAISRFIAATTAAANGAKPPLCVDVKRTIAVDRAEAELLEHGI